MIQDPRAGLGVDNCRLPCRIEVEYLKDHRAKLNAERRNIMKTREAWIDEARYFVENWTATSDEAITFEDVLSEVKDGWSDEVNYGGTPEEYARELFGYIKEEADECEVKEYYYWLDTMPTWTNEEGACALVRGELDEDGEKDRDTEDVILEFTEEDAGADKDADFPEWEKIDAYIESEIGFVPDYEIN